MPDITRESIQCEIESLQKKASRLRSQLEEVEQATSALEMTLSHFEPKPKKRVVSQEEILVTAEELAGQSLDEALVYIAKRNDGVINSRSVRPLLKDAGLLNGTQISHRLWSKLSDSDSFEQIGRGKYRLIREMHLQATLHG